MKSLFAAFIFLFAFAKFTDAQTVVVKGLVADSSSREPLVGARVSLTDVAKSTVSKSTSADANGGFVFADVTPGSYQLEITYIGYGRYQRNITIKNAALDLGAILLTVESWQLQQVTVVGQTPPATVNGDTVSYNARSYKTNPNANTEELVRKMPGVTVENGTVTSQGEDVQQVLVDGRNSSDRTLLLH
ncbi:carboxypeptidase regulatory-like domain-containing protein [Rubrolithibacter danxiaensis]|uniref:carboxypeptidase regulatory-like domain-containing protein n=1 Tax=Rubrolithibacter danxiaensis TaxID=3390805 RepID=UPI003BF813B0